MSPAIVIFASMHKLRFSSSLNWKTNFSLLLLALPPSLSWTGGKLSSLLIKISIFQPEKFSSRLGAVESFARRFLRKFAGGSSLLTHLVRLNFLHKRWRRFGEAFGLIHDATHEHAPKLCSVGRQSFQKSSKVVTKNFSFAICRSLRFRLPRWVNWVGNPIKLLRASNCCPAFLASRDHRTFLLA